MSAYVIDKHLTNIINNDPYEKIYEQPTPNTIKVQKEEVSDRFSDSKQQLQVECSEAYSESIKTSKNGSFCENSDA